MPQDPANQNKPTQGPATSSTGPRIITAGDLIALTPADVLSLDHALAEIARHGWGSVLITVADGRVQYMNPSPSIPAGRGLTVQFRVGPV